MKLSLYPDWKAGDISREEYHRLKEQFEQQQAKLDTRLASLQSRIDEVQNGVNETNSFLSQFVKYRSLQTLTREVVVELIDMIYVHEGGKITIKFKFFGCLCGSTGLYSKARKDRIVLKLHLPPLLPTPFPRCWRISAHSRGTLTASLPATSVTSARTFC